MKFPHCRSLARSLSLTRVCVRARANRYLQATAFDNKREFQDQGIICLRNLKQTMRLGGRRMLPDFGEVSAILGGKYTKIQKCVRHVSTPCRACATCALRALALKTPCFCIIDAPPSRLFGTLTPCSNHQSMPLPQKCAALPTLPVSSRVLARWCCTPADDCRC